jgi:hypothetical protein
MKYLKSLISILLIANLTHAQDKPTESDIKALVDSKNFLFEAQSASPMRGRTVHLSPGNTLKVSADTVVSDLPYYGRAHSAPMNPSDAGIKFTSSDFTYDVKDRKKSGWDVTIKAKDGTRSHQIYLTISSNGSASIRLVSSDRDAISYNGYIQKSK